MEPIEVTAYFDENGRTIPLRFTWKKSTYLVETTGRQWQDEHGWHILVMATGGQMFELLFACSEQRWYLGRVGPGPALA